MESVIQSIELFYPKILIGSILGSVLSCLGIILVLRNMSFFCITISQIATSIYAVTLFFGISGEYSVLLITLCMALPIFYWSAESNKMDTILGILFVSFSGFSQMLLAMGGNVKNHIVSAYLGDILLSDLNLTSPFLYLILFAFFGFILIYKKLLFLSFDRDEYLVRGSSRTIELIFLFILVLTLSISVNLLGSIYSSAQLLIPGFTAVLLFRSMGMVFFFSIFLSLFSGILGFMVSLIGFQKQNDIIYFPTSSTIVCFLALTSFVILIFRKLLIRKR